MSKRRFGAASIRLFLGVFAVASVALMAAIYSLPTYSLPTQYVVRSALEVGSALVGDKLEALETSDQIARQITGLFLPDTLAKLANTGMPVNILRQLENLKVEAVGRYVTLQNQGDLNIQPGAKELQNAIIDQIIRQRQTLAEAIQSGYDIRLALSRQTNEALKEQRKSLISRIDDTGIQLDAARSQNTARQTLLSEKIRRATVEKDLQRRILFESEVRELQDQVFHGQSLAKDLSSEQFNAIRDLAEVSKQIAEQTRSVSLAERDGRMLINLRQATAPSVLPIPAGSSRLYLILSAIILSFLAAVGTAAFWQRLRNSKNSLA
jgi:hypothetical protein